MQVTNALSPPQKKSKEHVYIGVAEGDWKQHYHNHIMSFENQERKNDTALSTFLWELQKSIKETPKLTWSVSKVVPGYSNISKRCLLGLNEKLLIATYSDQKQLLNKGSELIAMQTREQVPFSQLQSRQLICRLFLKKLILYIEYFQEKVTFI